MKYKLCGECGTKVLSDVVECQQCGSITRVRARRQFYSLEEFLTDSTVDLDAPHVDVEIEEGGIH